MNREELATGLERVLGDGGRVCAPRRVKHVRRHLRRGLSRGALQAGEQREPKLAF